MAQEIPPRPIRPKQILLPFRQVLIEKDQQPTYYNFYEEFSSAYSLFIKKGKKIVYQKGIIFWYPVLNEWYGYFTKKEIKTPTLVFSNKNRIEIHNFNYETIEFL